MTKEKNEVLGLNELSQFLSFCGASLFSGFGLFVFVSQWVRLILDTTEAYFGQIMSQDLSHCVRLSFLNARKFIL